MTKTRLAFLALLLGGCGTDGRQPIPFELRFEGAAPDAFVTNSGFTVELTELHVALGPVYLFGDVHDESAPMSSAVEFMSDLLVNTAHAHPEGEDAPEGLVGEFLEQVGVDVLDPDGSPPRLVRGYQEEVADVDAIVASPTSLTTGPAHRLQGQPAHVSGTASRGQMTISFTGTLSVPADEPPEVHVDADEFTPTAGGTFTITVDPVPWFADAQFDALTEQDASGRYVIGPGTQVANAWLSDLAAEGVLTGRFE